MKKRSGSGWGTGHNLEQMQRVLLVKLGRGSEALDSAWARFLAFPAEFTYEELIRYAPKAERRASHEKAMEASAHGDLASLIPLRLSTKELPRLVERLERATDVELERLSHFVLEPAAKRLVKSHPGLAAKAFRALCKRIVDAGKSKVGPAELHTHAGRQHAVAGRYACNAQQEDRATGRIQPDPAEPLLSQGFVQRQALQRVELAHQADHL